MKFVLLKHFTKIWKRKEEPEVNPTNTQFHGKVIRFEDCERINRERFRSKETTNINAKNQVYAALSVNILATSVGASIGWVSPSISFLQSQETTLDRTLNSDELSWLGGLLPLGALIGTFLFAWLSEKYGRFWILWLTAFPQIISWLCIIYATHVEHLYIARVLAGLCMGGTFALIPVYISEISNSNIRGTLNSFFLLSINFGTLLIFIIGNYLSYNLISRVNIILPVLFAIIFLFFPETPYYLLKCGKNKKAENSLKFLRGCRAKEQTPEVIKSEILQIAKKVEENENTRKTSLLMDELKLRSTQKALCYGIVLVLVNQLCGCMAFINYTSDIFMRSGSTLSPSISAIIVATIQLLGSGVSVLITEKVSRKLLYSLSCCATIFGLLAFGTHGFIKGFLDIAQFDWIPIASMSLVIFAASLGILPLTFIMLSELLPMRIRSYGVSICTGILWFTAFVLLRFFPTAVDIFQLHGCMFIFCVITFMGMIFVIAFVPETKNKTPEEIEKQLQ
ncbi:facilitated trehalose transporter Tret1-like [Chironomus tepperi]|uniref:facilitated trehalose transporter Tret1-like n=1 Tax=Chironomus tepperi TaxID=113505 RepID=UPI00391F7568